MSKRRTVPSVQPAPTMVPVGKKHTALASAMLPLIVSSLHSKTCDARPARCTVRVTTYGYVGGFYGVRRASAASEAALI